MNNRNTEDICPSHQVQWMDRKKHINYTHFESLDNSFGDSFFKYAIIRPKMQTLELNSKQVRLDSA